MRRSGRSELAHSALVAVTLAVVLRGFVAEAFHVASTSMIPTLAAGDHVVVWKLANGLRLPFADRWLVRWSSPRRGDVVVFSHPLDRGRVAVSRVVGLPGDAVELRDQVVYVNGVPQPRQVRGEVSYEEADGGSARCASWRETLAVGSVVAPRTLIPSELSRAFERAAAQGLAVHEVVQCRADRLGAREGPFDRVAADHLFVLADNRDRSSDSRSGQGWQVPIGQVKGRAALVWWSWGKAGWWPGVAAGGLRTDRLFKWIE